MRTDTEIRSLGFQVLFKYMDVIEAEKFISIINREKFDYTEWRQTLFEDMTIEDIIKDAKVQLNLSILPQGIYTISITLKDEMRQKKFIISPN